MPYSWTKPDPSPARRELHLWPYQSLPAKGFAAFIFCTFSMILLPLFPLLGSVVLWGVLPFLMMAVGGMWFALSRSRQNAQILEVLTLTDDQAHLVRHDPKGLAREWNCNRYWAKPQMHLNDGPVPYYVTLKGAGREVEIGAFLSEDERMTLYEELNNALTRDLDR